MPARIAALLERAAEAEQVTVAELKSASRKRPLARARFAVIHHARDAGLSYERIGRGLDRHWMTIVKGSRRADALIESDPQFAALVRRIAPETL